MAMVYFISDVHLGAQSGAQEANRVAKLARFLEAVRHTGEELHIVGDLFNFWFEYRWAIPKVNLKILFKLYQLVESGVRINYFAGNHDAWLGTYLKNEVGVNIIHSPSVVTHNSLTFYVAHGDGVLKQDRRQRLLSSIFKNRANIFLYKLLHPDIGIPLANFVARKSSERAEESQADAYRAWALEKLAQDYDGVIVGHTHKPIFEKIGSKYYVNLGDWLDDFTYLELEGAKVELRSWIE